MRGTGAGSDLWRAGVPGKFEDSISGCYPGRGSAATRRTGQKHIAGRYKEVIESQTVRTE